MSKEQILQQIKELEKHNFMLNMGSWDLRTADIIRNNNKQIKELKAML